MTYSILARDPETGEVGVATQSQAFAVGHSVPWALPGAGAIATQSMGEPAYGDLGLDALSSGLTAQETLTALRSIDPHPERRQVAMIDVRGNIAAYTGGACVGKAGHRIEENCCSIANMMSSDRVWEEMVDVVLHSKGSLAPRLMAALHAAEAVGGDFRGKRSAAIRVVRAERSGRPWRDNLVDLRVDCHDDPLTQLDTLVHTNARYNRMVRALERALDGDAQSAEEEIQELNLTRVRAEPDLHMWRAAVMTLAGHEAEAVRELQELARCAPEFVRVFRQLREVGAVQDSERWDRVLSKL